MKLNASSGTAKTAPSIGRRRVRAVPAVTRATAILRLLAQSDTPLRLQKISEALDLFPSTCLHILRALVVEELIAFDEDAKSYQLGVGLLSLSRKLLKRNEFANIVGDVLETIAQRHGVTTIGIEVSKLDHVVVMAISRAKEPFHIHVDVGSRFPALVSASGRCIAAFSDHDEDEIKARFKLVRWDRAPSYTQWQREVAVARQQRFSVDSDQYIHGITVVSAPVLHGPIVENLLVVVGLTDRLQSKIGKIGRELVEQAALIARRLND